MKRPTPLRDSPFAYTRPPEKRGWVERMRGTPRPDLATRALQHILAQRDPSRISDADISALLLEYGVGGPEARQVLVQMWRDVLAAFLSDDRFSDRETAYLEALRQAFGLTDQELQNAEREVVHPRYSVALAEALSDARLSDPERVALGKLAQGLRLPDAVQQDLFARSGRALLGSILEKSAADRRLSPDELEELASVARHLGVTPDFDKATERMLDRYALFWRIENGDYPSLVVDDIPLDADETCHADVEAERYQPGETAEAFEEGIGGVRIARGVYYRAGSVSHEPMSRSSLTRADSGRLLITSRRVLFHGKSEPLSLRLRDIPSYQVYTDGLVVERRSGSPTYFTVAGDVELIAVILGAALAKG